MIFLLTFALIFLSFIGLGIGYILTGKSKLHKKCGSSVNNTTEDKKNGKCGQGGCDMCKK